MRRIAVCAIVVVSVQAATVSTAGEWNAPFLGGWSESSHDVCDDDTCSDGTCDSWWTFRCRWDRNCKRFKPVRTCYPEFLPIGGPHYGYHETCWRRLPPQCCYPPVETGSYEATPLSPYFDRFVLPEPETQGDAVLVPPPAQGLPDGM